MRNSSSSRGGSSRFGGGRPVTQFQMPYVPPAPMIDARTRMSPVDVAAAARGTNASPLAGANWDDVFHHGRQGYVPGGSPAPVAAPAPAQSAPTNSTFPGGPGPKGATLAQDKKIYAPHDPAPVRGTAATAPAGPPATGSVIQSLLDKASGQPSTGATRIPQGFGSASVRFEKTPPGASAAIFEKDAQGNIVKNAAGQPNQIGVGRAEPFDVGAARQRLIAAHPNVAIAGTPENKAFVDAANKNGEQWAHENADQIVGAYVPPKENAGAPLFAGDPDQQAAEAASRAALDKRTPLVKGFPETGPVPSGKTGKQIAADANATRAQAEANKPPGILGTVAALPGKAVDAAADLIRDRPLGPEPSAPSTAATNAPAGGAVGLTLPAPRQGYVPATASASSVDATVASNNAPPEDEDKVPNYAGGYAGGPFPYDPLTGGTPYVPGADFAPGGGIHNYTPQTLTGSAANAATAPGNAALQSSLNRAQAGLASQMPAAVGHARNETAVSEAQAPGGSLGGRMQGGDTTRVGQGYSNDKAGQSTFDQEPMLPNYARGYVPGGAGLNIQRPTSNAQRPMKSAVLREKTAIARGVGGARPSDKPLPVKLNGRPAVINSGERVLPTPRGPAVLNRQMQRRMPYVPGRS